MVWPPPINGSAGEKRAIAANRLKNVSSGPTTTDGRTTIACGAAAKANKDPTTGAYRDVCLADDARVRSSVGASILWNSPLGPLRADYAFPLQREKYDVVERFRFGASTKF